MSKSMVVISGYVDTTLREQQKDMTFYIFKTLEELDNYVVHTPIRADTLFFSRDVIPLINSSLNYLVNILDKAFFRVDNVVYITERNSPEIESIKFLVKSKGYTNWEVMQGALTREYVTGVINGSARDDSSVIKRKAVYRIPKDEYVKQKTRNNEKLAEEAYPDDDMRMQDMEDEDIPPYLPPDKEQTCHVLDIVGESRHERTLFVFIMAQYLATRGRTIILERDCEYHRLGELVTKSGVQCKIVYVDDIINNPVEILDELAYGKDALTVCLCNRRVRYDYNFIFSLIFNYCAEHVPYMVRECEFGEEPTESDYMVVFPNTMTGVLSMCDRVNMNFIQHTKFIAIHTGNFNELRLPNKSVIDKIIADILNVRDTVYSELLTCTSTVLGGDDAYDLRSVL